MVTFFAKPKPRIEDDDLLREVIRDISGTTYFDPISDPPTQELQAISIGLRHTNTTRYPIISKSPWPLEHMFAAVCAHIRPRAPVPRYIILPDVAYRKHLEDVLTPRPFDGLFLFQISGMKRPFHILVYRDVELNTTLPPNVILCIS
ncbi:MAG TPA: hypothetical protein VHV10_05160 [Ktedonobacteraceae bacterium]|jgi:hypothetical protein|nr:hypothetical protein [Ktedonobacteraceae bacterium]